LLYIVLFILILPILYYLFFIIGLVLWNSTAFIDEILKHSTYRIIGYTNSFFITAFSWGILGAIIWGIIGVGKGFYNLKRTSWCLILIIPAILIILLLFLSHSQPLITISTTEKISVKIYGTDEHISLAIDASNYQKEFTSSTIDEIIKQSQVALIKNGYSVTEDKIKCTEVNPSFIYWYKEGKDYFVEKNYEEAIKCFNKVLELKPDYFYVWKSKGLTLDKQGNYEEAIKCYDGASKIDPNYSLIWNNNEKGNIYYKHGQYEKAIKCYDKILIKESKNPVILCNKGQALMCQQKYTEAIKYYSKALKIDPDYKVAKSNKEKVLKILKDLEYFKKVSPYYKKGDNAYKSKKYDDAIYYYNIILDINHKDKNAWYRKANSLFCLGYYELALECYKKVLYIDYKDVDAWCGRGNALYSLGRHTEAIKCYRKAVEINPFYKTPIDLNYMLNQNFIY
ncbi:MAG: tetratricopeptide repeat protein, partial [Candidatus Eremiobacterota bacterium]